MSTQYSLHSSLDAAVSTDNPAHYPSSPTSSVQSSSSDFSFSSSASSSSTNSTLPIHSGCCRNTTEFLDDYSSLRGHNQVARNVPTRINIPHPYARLFSKKDEVKRRKIWNHALEKSLFTPYELSTLGAPHRRGIYVSSLEAHIDRLHGQLLDLGFWPVAFNELEPYRGLNTKTAKSMVANLQHESSTAKLKLLELERANEELTNTLRAPGIVHTSHGYPTGPHL